MKERLKKKMYWLLFAIFGGGMVLGAITTAVTLDATDTKFSEERDYYYSLQKMQPGCKESVVDGYDGPVVRCENGTEVKSSDVLKKYKDKGGSEKESEKILQQL